jgi:hypothetical protein
MLKAFILCLTIVVSSECISQGFINTNKKVAKRYLRGYITNKNIKTLTTETDTTIVFLVRDTSVQNLDLILYFDKDGKCVKEERKLTCDSCLKKIFAQTLSYRNYKWMQINDTGYISKFSKKLLLKKNKEPEYSFTIQKFSMTRREYKDLLQKNKLNQKK